jgi:hypothetical protein
VLRDVRLLHDADVKPRAYYPLLVLNGKAFTRKCQVRTLIEIPY